LGSAIQRRLGYRAGVNSTRDRTPAPSGAPVSLSGIQVDVTTRLGVLTPATPTGLQTLDRMLSGGLRTGTLMSISGAPGVGKTAFALLMAYMTARARAAVVFTSVALDETEIVARLAARALHREFPDVRTPYGAIWSGQASQDEMTRRPVGEAVETVVKKVGNHLHLHRAKPFESTSSLAKLVSHLWGRHDRVILVVDGLEAFCAGGGEGKRAAVTNGSYDARVAQVAYELRQLADEGCAVVATVQSRSAPLVSPAATLASELRAIEGEGSPVAMPERSLALGARAVELSVVKNSVGPTGIVPLRFIAGAALFEERAP
jgi:archaellum biogenesis ATPase FlaH